MLWTVISRNYYVKSCLKNLTVVFECKRVLAMFPLFQRLWNGTSKEKMKLWNRAGKTPERVKWTFNYEETRWEHAFDWWPTGRAARVWANSRGCKWTGRFNESQTKRRDARQLLTKSSREDAKGKRSTQKELWPEELTGRRKSKRK